MATPPANLPLSIYSTVGLVVVGARGKTLEELRPAWRLIRRRRRPVRERPRLRPILLRWKPHHLRPWYHVPPGEDGTHASLPAHRRTVNFAEVCPFIFLCCLLGLPFFF